MMRRGDPMLLQRFAVADTRQHQQLRRLERARRQDHLAPRTDRFRFLALDILDANGALAVEDDARCLRAGLDAQVRPRPHMRVDVAARGAPAFAVLLRHLIDAEPLLLGAVEIVANAELPLARALQEHLAHRIVRLRTLDMQWAALAVIFAVKLGIVLRTLEVGQHVGVGPAGIAERGPLIVVGTVAAAVDHGVDRRGASEALAARLVADAAVQSLLRYGVE